MKRYTGLSIGVLWGVLLFLALPFFATRAAHLIGKNEVVSSTGSSAAHRLMASSRAYSLLRESARLAEPRLPAAVRQVVTFTLQSDKPSATVQAGQSAQFTIAAKSPQNVRISVFLEARNLPATTSATFVPRGIRPNDDPSRMTITTQPGTPPGTYQFEVVGTYAGPPRVVQTLPLTLVVTGAPVQDFTMTALPTEQSARPGETVKFEIKTAGVNGYSGPITLQMPQLPAGITGELAPLTV